MYCRHLWFRSASETSAIMCSLQSHKSSYSAYIMGLNNTECVVLCIWYLRPHTCWLFLSNPLPGNCSGPTCNLCGLTASAHRWNLLSLCNERIPNRLPNRQERTKVPGQNNHHRSSNQRKRKTLLAPRATVYCYCSPVMFGQDVPLRCRGKYTGIKAFIKSKGSPHWE